MDKRVYLFAGMVLGAIVALALYFLTPAPQEKSSFQTYKERQEQMIRDLDNLSKPHVKKKSRGCCKKGGRNE